MDRQSFRTSIPELDKALGPHLDRGNFLVCAGLTGGGKTIFAGQVTTRMVVDGYKVLFVSTEVEHVELERRMLSAWCDIPYETIMDSLRTVSVAGSKGINQVPDPDLYGGPATIKAAELVDALRRNCRFKELRPAGLTPGVELELCISDYEKCNGSLPDVIVYDYLRAPRVSEADIDGFKFRSAVINVAKTLRALAKDHNILVIAFCQANPALNTSKKIGLGDIRDFKAVSELADGSIGISHRKRADADIEAAGEIRERVQHFTVVTESRPQAVLVPVVTNFAYQRFDPYEGKGAASAERRLDANDRNEARLLETKSEFRGYVLARRRKFYTIFTCGNPYAINLYAFLLVAADSQGGSFYGRETLKQRLGLSVKRLRTATDYLKRGGWITTAEPEFRRSLRYTITDWKADQNPGTKGYFKLTHNLRDELQSDLVADRDLFRVWLYLLCEARPFEDEAAGLELGEVLIRPRHAEETLGLSKDTLHDIFDRLEDRGSVSFRGAGWEKLAITNWELYQKRLYPSDYAEGRRSEML